MKASELIYILSAAMVHCGDLEVSLSLEQLKGDFGQKSNPQIPLVFKGFSDDGSRRFDISVRFDRNNIFDKEKLDAVKTFLNSYI